MIDIHSHILFGIDDGCSNILESITLLDKMWRKGITDVILTPHYIKNTKFSADNLKKKDCLEELRNEIKRRDIGINIYLGNEIYIDDDIIELLQVEAMSLNGSRYVLIELPLNNKYPFLEDVICQLLKRGMIPVIAHPERYKEYFDDIDFFSKMVEMGCLFQGNLGSLFGIYGKKSKRQLEKLLRNDFIHFLGNDIHHNMRWFNYKRVVRKLNRILLDEDKVLGLLSGNAKKILEDKSWL